MNGFVSLPPHLIMNSPETMAAHIHLIKLVYQPRSMLGQAFHLLESRSVR